MREKYDTPVFAPLAEDVIERIDALFEYLKSGILINEISDNEYNLSRDVLLAGIMPYVDRLVYIDTPNREVTIALLRYPQFAKRDEAHYYVLFQEELAWSDPNTIIAACTEVQRAEILKKMISILEWYKENRGNILEKKVETFLELMRNVASPDIKSAQP
jgi:hypothetical protein